MRKTSKLAFMIQIHIKRLCMGGGGGETTKNIAIGAWPIFSQKDAKGSELTRPQKTDGP